MNGTVLRFRRVYLAMVVAGIASILPLVLGFSGGAAEAASGGGFVVSPAFQQIEIKSSQTEGGYTLQLTNHNTTDQTFVLRVADFGSLDESGGVAFLGDPTTELEHKYGLASWMSLEKNTVFVPAGKTVGLLVSIENRQSLAPGGHYGAVLATAVSDPGAPVGDAVGVKQVLASLVLVTKDGGANPDLRLVSQTFNAQFWHMPSAVEQRFQNAGNLHVVPRGIIEVKDPAGRVVERTAINDGSQVILPESFRRYTSALLSLKAAVLPGHYTVVSTYRYDGTDTTKTLVSGFWYAGQLIVWLVMLLALAGGLGLAWWLWWRPRKKGAKKLR